MRERSPLQCAASGCPGCEVCAIELKKWLRNKANGLFCPEDFKYLEVAANRIEALENALRESMEWNWMDSDTDSIPDWVEEALPTLYINPQEK